MLNLCLSVYYDMAHMEITHCFPLGMSLIRTAQLLLVNTVKVKMFMYQIYHCIKLREKEIVLMKLCGCAGWSVPKLFQTTNSLILLKT